MVLTHWLACILALQTIFSATPSDSDGRDGVVRARATSARTTRAARAAVRGALGLRSRGTAPTRIEARSSLEEARRVDARDDAQPAVPRAARGLAGGADRRHRRQRQRDPDATAFKNRGRPQPLRVLLRAQARRAQRREYFYDAVHARGEARREIVSELRPTCSEEITSLVNNKWLSTVAFFRGMTTPEGVVVAPPAEGAFLAKVAVALQSTVYAPIERPPRVGCTSSTRELRAGAPNGFSWGALDVMLPNAPLVKRAVATTYLHVLWVDGPTLRAIAEDFPTTTSTGCASTCSIGCGERRRREKAKVVKERRKPGSLRKRRRRYWPSRSPAARRRRRRQARAAAAGGAGARRAAPRDRREV